MLKCQEFNITVRKAKREDMVQVYKLIKVRRRIISMAVSNWFNLKQGCTIVLIKFKKCVKCYFWNIIDCSEKY